VSVPVVVHVDADTEVEEATVWYEARRAGLGLEFVAAADHVLVDIGEAPERFPTWAPPWRRAVLRRFPFVVFYEVEQDHVAVMAVAHARRRPGYWVARGMPEAGP
jgi:hypothetical protein